MSSNIFAIVRQACELEATAIKAGNVHPHRNFADTTYQDFITSSHILEKTWSEHSDAPVGQWIYLAVDAVRRQIGKNTNLGIILLLAPLAKAALLFQQDNLDHFPSHQILGQITRQDTDWVYRAIRLANPGGLNRSSQHDVHSKPPECLITAMQTAASYDDIAKQYVTNFSDVYELAQQLSFLRQRSVSILEAISRLQIDWMAQHIDTLIQRKCGQLQAEDVKRRAAQVLESRSLGTQQYQESWNSFDSFLRSDDNRMNPGTTADLLAAAIFVYLVQQTRES